MSYTEGSYTEAARASRWKAAVLSVCFGVGALIPPSVAYYGVESQKATVELTQEENQAAAFRDAMAAFGSVRGQVSMTPGESHGPDTSAPGSYSTAVSFPDPAASGFGPASMTFDDTGFSVTVGPAPTTQSEDDDVCLAGAGTPEGVASRTGAVALQETREYRTLIYELDHGDSDAAGVKLMFLEASLDPFDAIVVAAFREEQPLWVEWLREGKQGFAAAAALMDIFCLKPAPPGATAMP